MPRTNFGKWERFKRGLGKSPALSSATLVVSGLAIVEGYDWAFFVSLALLIALLLCRLWKQAVVATLFGVVAGFLHWQQLQEQKVQAILCRTELQVKDTVACVNEVRGRSIFGWVENEGQRIAVEFSGIDSEVIEPADRIRVSGYLRAIPVARNPKRFDFSHWMWRRGLVGQFVVKDYETVSGLAWQGLVRRYGNRSANFLERRLSLGLEKNDPGRQVILGIVLGKQNELGEEQVSAFRRSGSLHVFAVSGMHVGIVALIAWAILRWLGIDRHRLAWLLILLMFAYAWITGLRPSALRAAVMGAAVLSGLVMRRRSGGLNRLSIAVVFLLLCDGHQLFTASFQLSFAVMASVLIIGPQIERFLPFRQPIDSWLPRPLWSEADMKWHGFVISLRGMIVVTISAWLGSTVLSLVHFQQISPAGLLTSIPMVMGAFVVLSLGAVSLITGSAFPLVISLNAKIATAMASFALSVGTQPWAAIDTREELAASECWILDADSGGAVVFGGEEFTVLDVGNEKIGLQEVLPALECFRNPPGSVILSHGDGDHVGGALCLWERSHSWNFILPDESPRSPALRKLSKALVSSRDQPRRACAGMTLEIGEGTLSCLAEGSPDYGLDRADDRCSIWLWEREGAKVLFMNDAGIAREQALVEAYPHLEVDVLVLGKHRRDLSGTMTFISAVKPQLVVATHLSFPKQEARSERWFEEIRKSGTKLMLSEDSGAIHLRLEDGQIRAKSILGNREFYFRAKDRTE